MREPDLPALADLFASEWSTRHCWCMAFCSTRGQFALGWFGGGNARRFAVLASRGSTPMGVLALRAGAAVGWCACGPRSRYAAAGTPRTTLIRDRAAGEHETVWFVPCLFVRAGSRGQGVTHVLVGAAVDLARRAGAVAIEGWPIADPGGRPTEAFVGRESVFADAGFRCVARPTADRVIMRRDL